MDERTKEGLKRWVAIPAGVAAAAVIVWFLLGFLFEVASWIALPLLLLTAIFLIVLVLVQRGKGGGLAGAFGGLGGQSAFGTKAGDLFTRVTIGVALFWIILCMVTVSVRGTAEDIVEEDVGEGNPIRRETSPLSSDKEPGRSSEQPPAGGTGPSGSQDSSS